ncbi:mechanosensitive ion channel [Halomonas sabkhae]|uniref:mechanosensitive ion channel family protein n=1 Tax=Halomonas sabkhae TaxID=626223 RepID=UPI0025B366F3|nr:mechanosensitive ion channel domain-containing protein [Halomonas sabkhae]MDN3524828.1 mechanosensitive ion channel [Halomonas sabkhae]
MVRWQKWLMLVVFLLASTSIAVAQDGASEQGWYSVNALNSGLGQAPELVDRRTPREAMRTFRNLTEQGEFEAAAHVLNLNDLSLPQQRKRGAQLAERLATILQRGKWLQISELPSRQDGSVSGSASQGSQARPAGRTIELASLDTPDHMYDIRLGRYKAGDASPVWLVTPESVAGITALYETYGPREFEKYIPERLKASLGLLKIWEWIALPLVLLAIAMIGKGVHALLGTIKPLIPSGSRSIFVEKIRVPMALIVMSLVTQAMLNYIVSFSAVATTTLRVLLFAVLAWGAGAMALRLVDTIMLKMTRRMVGDIDDTKSQDDRKLLTTLYAIRRVVILVSVTVVTIYVLGQVRLFESLGLSILASASVLAVLVGIAGQAVLGNILSSFQLSLAKPVRVGDLVYFEGQWCHVEGIFFTFIRLKIWNERRLVVPVMYFASKPFENMSAKEAKEYRCVELTLHLSADIEKIREKFVEFAKAEEDVIEHHKLFCCITAQNTHTQVISCYLMASDPISSWMVEASVREKLLAFVRDDHPEWWPRDVVVLSRHDIAQGHGEESSEASP